jgi:hypothetical protein
MGIKKMEIKKMVISKRINILTFCIFFAIPIRVVFLNHPLQDKLKFHNPAEMKINKSLSSSI